MAEQGRERALKRFGLEEERDVIKILRSERLSGFYGNFRGGPYVRQFEADFARYHSVKNAVSVSSGTAALHTVLEALKVQGRTVVTTPLSFVSTASAIHMARGRIAFTDVSALTYNLDENAIPGNPGFIIPVHLLGTPCDVDALRARFPNAVIIEDCAQALGAKLRGRRIGTIGDVGTFSLQETKSISTGEGGMIITDNDELAEKCRRIRNHGEKYANGPELGYNYRMTEIAAALGIHQLKKLDRFNRIQVNNARELIKMLPKGFKPPYIPPYMEPVFFIVGTLYQGGLLNRARFLDFVTREGINLKLPGRSIGPGYDKLIYQLPYFQRSFQGICPTAESLLPQFVWFDIHRWRSTPAVKSDMKRMREYFAGIKVRA